MTFHALVIEPDGVQCRAIRNALLPDNWVVSEIGSPEEAMKLIDQHAWAIVFCDMGESGKELHLLRELKMRIGDTVPIIMTAARVNPQTVLETMLNGAFDFIGKPYREAEIRERSRLVIERLQAAERESHNRQQEVMPDFTSAPAVGQYEIVGKSEAITKVTSEIAKALRKDHDKANASTESIRTQRPPTFFITGETGTGKELVARAIHRHSRYRAGSFVAINCSNLPAEVADAELFGSTPGAFTGAAREVRMGLWESAAGGTLFLDEITEAPRSLFPKLLRVLQDGRIKRLGATQWFKVDLQIVAASNKDVAADVKRGHFREDLYHRLSLHQIYLPPLRERLEDVPLLAAHFARFYSGGAVSIARDALHLLIDFSQGYEWRGNIREIENVIQRAITQATDSTVYAIDLAPHLPKKNITVSLFSSKRECGNIEDKRVACMCNSNNHVGLEERVRRFRNDVIKETLASHNNNRSRAAKTLQISRSKMHRMVGELEQERESC